jgi:hypothetical protein
MSAGTVPYPSGYPVPAGPLLQGRQHLMGELGDAVCTTAAVAGVAAAGWQLLQGRPHIMDVRHRWLGVAAAAAAAAGVTAVEKSLRQGRWHFCNKQQKIVAAANGSSSYTCSSTIMYALCLSLWLCCGCAGSPTPGSRLSGTGSTTLDMLLQRHVC